MITKTPQRTGQLYEAMSIERKKTLRDVMTLAWSLVKTYGISIAEALVKAWKNIKLKAALYKGVVEFHFKKVDGSIRQAFGTLKGDLIPTLIGSDRRRADNIQTYFDVERGEWRCFKRINLL